MLNPPVPREDLKRLLADSRDSTLTTLDELCFIRLCLNAMASGLSYDDALQSTYAQMTDNITGE